MAAIPVGCVESGAGYIANSRRCRRRRLIPLVAGSLLGSLDGSEGRRLRKRARLIQGPQGFCGGVATSEHGGSSNAQR
jgi:hypothetical protein